MGWLGAIFFSIAAFIACMFMFVIERTDDAQADAIRTWIITFNALLKGLIAFAFNIAAGLALVVLGLWIAGKVQL